MAMKVTCSCGQGLEIDAQLAGQIIQCPACQKQFMAPAPQAGCVTGGVQQDAVLGQMQQRAVRSLVFGSLALGLYLILCIIAYIIGANERRGEPGPIMSIMFLILVFVAVTCSILAIVLGVKAKSPANTRNRGLAITGMIMGIVGACLGGCCLGIMAFGAIGAITSMNR